MRFILLSLLFFSYSSFADYKVIDDKFPKLTGIEAATPQALGAKLLNQCVQSARHSHMTYIFDSVVSAGSMSIYLHGTGYYFDPTCTGTNTAGAIQKLRITQFLFNYCDSIQYQLDYKAAQDACLASATDNQNVSFSASCDRENEVLIKQCTITDKPKPKPEPDLCPDGSVKPDSGICPDTGGGGGDGGDTGGGGDTKPPTDLTSVIAAITKGAGDIVKANNQHDPLLEAVNKSFDEANKTLTASKDNLSNIESKTEKVGDSVNKMNTDVNKNLGSVVGELKSNNDLSAQSNNQDKERNDKLDQQLANQSESLDNERQSLDELSNIGSGVGTMSDSLKAFGSEQIKTNYLLGEIRDSLNKGADGSAYTQSCLGNAGVPCPFGYDSKYPEIEKFIDGRFTELRHKSGIDNFVNQFVFTEQGGQYPNWSLDLSQWGWGVHDLSLDPMIWKFLKACLLFGAAVLCRKIILGG
ncbi:hypothetical protein ACN08P_19800 [Photobacterium leiognathi subsp. mandapamensis]|uniref:hypothetical protein n=1 Tax=Photobacterium leiognathi TaxID=553611 RepID=UPI003AF36089